MGGVLCFRVLVLMVWGTFVGNVVCEVRRDELNIGSNPEQIPSSPLPLPPLLFPPPSPPLPQPSPPLSPPLSPPPTLETPPPVHHHSPPPPPRKPKHRPRNKTRTKKSSQPYHPKPTNRGKEIGYWFMGVVVVLQIAVVGFLVYKKREFANICSRHENCS